MSPGEREIWPPARHLDRVARVVAAEWGLTLGERYSWARFSFTAPTDGMVLKVTPPEDDEADHEPDALTLWDGDGAVRLVRHDRARRAMLLERAVPGEDATTIPDDEAISVALGIGRRLWRRVEGGPFRRAHDEVRRWLNDAARSGHRYIAIAERTFARMERREDVLVHGDLHHYNLLSHGDAWVAIDPKPLLAEPEFDVVTLLWNPVHVAPTAAIVERRIHALVDAGLNERRIRDWAIVRGTYLGLPLAPGENEVTVRQLAVVRCLLPSL